MNKQQIKGRWKQLNGEIKKKWGGTTDDDFLQTEGDLQKLAGRIQQRSGDDLETIDQWLRNHYNTE